MELIGSPNKTLLDRIEQGLSILNFGQFLDPRHRYGIAFENTERAAGAQEGTMPFAIDRARRWCAEFLSGVALIRVSLRFQNASPCRPKCRSLKCKQVSLITTILFRQKAAAEAHRENNPESGKFAGKAPKL